MRSTGIVLRMDDMCRIAIPKALCRKLKISEFDPFEIYTEEDDKIILKKYQPACIFCGNADNVTFFCDKRICADCLKKLKEKDI